MGSSKVNTTIVPLSAAVKKISSEAWTSSGRLLERRRPSLRKRLGLAGAEQGRAGDRDHTEPGKSAQSGEDPHPRDRCLGARLLSDLPKPAAGVHRGLLQCGQLGQGQRALQGRSRQIGQTKMTRRWIPPPRHLDSLKYCEQNGKHGMQH